MERFAMRRWVYVFFMAIFFACTSKDTKTQFEISGVVTNNSVQKIYLEEAQAGGSGRTVVDSFVIGEDGQYRLKTKPREAMLYGIRLANHEVPSLFVINDAPKISVDIELNKQNAQLIDKYEVKQSPASTAMKNFISAFDNDLQKLYSIIRRANSLKSQNAPDSSILPLQKEWTIVAENIKDHGLTAINEADNPALIVFELGYFQGLNNDYGLEPLTLKQEFDILSKASNKFPDHKGLAEIKRGRSELLAQVSAQNEAMWMGKPAPDFSLPDVNGKQVALSSFKGKYVLVDFWASWCGPCRAENPNVVEAFNKFQNKNFTVLGVSLDKPGEKDKWLKAIKQDNLTWTHISDLKHWESSVIPLYRFNGIPYNVLVDTAGIVIGENLRGSALEAKLAEVLK